MQIYQYDYSHYYSNVKTVPYIKACEYCSKDIVDNTFSLKCFKMSRPLLYILLCAYSFTNVSNNV